MKPAYDLIIRADASQKFGQGHVRRNLNLADAFRKAKPDATILWAGSEETFALMPSLKETFYTLTLTAPEQAAQVMHMVQAIGDTGEKKPGFIIDGYHLDHETTNMARAQNMVGTTVFVDEKQNRHLGDTHFVADFMTTDPQAYKSLTADFTQLMIGPMYQMVSADYQKLAEWRRLELAARKGDEKKTVVLMNGGLNIGHMLEDLVNDLDHAGLWKDCRFRVFMLKGAKLIFDVRSAVLKAKKRGIDITLTLDVPDFPMQLAMADLYVGAAGLTPYELGAVGGVPSIVLAAGHNQDKIATLVEDSGAGLNAGVYANVVNNEIVPVANRKHIAHNAISLARMVLDAKNSCKNMAAASRGLCDGRGAERVARTLLTGNAVLKL